MGGGRGDELLLRRDVIDATAEKRLTTRGNTACHVVGMEWEHVGESVRKEDVTNGK